MSSLDQSPLRQNFCQRHPYLCGLMFALVIALSSGCRSNKPGGGFFGNLTKSRPRPEANVPPRRPESEIEEQKQLANQSVHEDEINLTEFKPGSINQPAVELDGATVVARVNSQPIFAEEVLFPFAKKLAKVEVDLPPEDRNRLRAKIIQENLQQHLEKAILVGALRESMKREELKKLDEQLDKIWNEEEIPRLMRDYKVGTRVELERILDEQGSSLANLQPSFKSREMAMYHMGQKSKTATNKLGPKELRAYYDEHRDQYKIEARARWQALHVNFKKHGSKKAASEVLNEAIEELRNDAEFGDVIKRYSDGPHKADGGIYDWTTIGSLANGDINRLLGTAEVGRISSPITANDSYMLIKVLEREDEHYREFEDVQKELSDRLNADARREASEKILQELFAQANIWTIFDKQ